MNDDLIKYKIGIAGLGMVGGALKRYFEKKPHYKLFLYDLKGIGSLDEINQADFIYLCLPTPYNPAIGCDITAIEEVVSQIKGEKNIIIKSTVIPGATDKLQEKYCQHKFLFNPEFLTEETADEDTRFPDRQIVGYTDKSYDVAKDVVQQLPLAPFERIVPAAVAEFIKYGGNTWFSVKVAKNNEMYDLCRKFGLDEKKWEMVVDGMAADKRIGRTHLTIMHKNKRGYFGKCLPKDAKALLDFAKKLEVDLPVLGAADKYNDKLLESQGYKKYI